MEARASKALAQTMLIQSGALGRSATRNRATRSTSPARVHRPNPGCRRWRRVHQTVAETTESSSHMTPKAVMTVGGSNRIAAYYPQRGSAVQGNTVAL